MDSTTFFKIYNVEIDAKYSEFVEQMTPSRK